MSIAVRTVIEPGEGEAVQLTGLGVVSKITADETGGSFAIVEHPLAVGALAAPMHTHAHEDEYSFVLEGTVGVRIGNDEFVAEPGAYILKPRGIPHTFWNAGSVPARLIEIISPAGFERFFPEMAAVVASWDPGVPPDLGAVIEVGARYGLTFDMESVPELVQRHGLRFGD